MSKNLIIVDVETLGLDPEIHSMIELAALKVNPDTLQIIDERNWIIQPDLPIENASPIALKLNGFDPNDFIYAPDVPTVLREFSEFARDGILLSWNITFDNKFLERAFKFYNIENQMHYHKLDIPSMYWFIGCALGSIPPSLSLKNVCDRLGVPREPDVHNALDGAKTALRCLEVMRDKTRDLFAVGGLGIMLKNILE